jgi:hypothetical protein
MIQFSFVTILNALFDSLISPIGPSMVLAIGTLFVWIIGRYTRNVDLTGTTAVVFWIAATAQVLGLRIQPQMPIYSRAWKPIILPGANLLWVGDGWNWYVSLLIILLGGVAILLGIFVDGDEESGELNDANRQITTTLASNLGVLSVALLFVGSGNLLTVTLTWVVMDLLILARNALVAPSLQKSNTDDTPARPLFANQAQGFSLFGALLLLISLLPAGVDGPGQPLFGGVLPIETVFLLLLASAIRAGSYPFHLWLLPANSRHIRLPNRFLDHLIPGLCGLWLLGWASGLGGKELLQEALFVGLVLLALVASAVAAYTATEKPGHTTFVLITSVGIAGLTSILSGESGPAALIWPTTTFALGGGLWLVGERIWREWGWQLPVSIGALALVGVPFTPGFLTQSAIARLLAGDFSGNLVMPFFAAYILAQSIYVSAMLRSWGVQSRDTVVHSSSYVWRLLISSIILALPLVVAGIFPRFMAALAGIANTIPQNVGNPPSAVADTPVWLTLGVPLLLGMGLAVIRPYFWQSLGRWPDRVARLAGLEWVAQFTGWTGKNSASVWKSAIDVMEGRGAVGWLITFALIGFFLLS